MYLLKLNRLLFDTLVEYQFTFHHVSIKTNSSYHLFLAVHHSHSTMYLLKLDIVTDTIYELTHSHSTMYLLKPMPTNEYNAKVSLFTFHHVSIKTYTFKCAGKGTVLFTFHHVSIKTSCVTSTYIT